jgi:hypothetical protein
MQVSFGAIERKCRGSGEPGRTRESELEVLDVREEFVPRAQAVEAQLGQLLFRQLHQRLHVYGSRM